MNRESLPETTPLYTLRRALSQGLLIASRRIKRNNILVSGHGGRKMPVLAASLAGPQYMCLSARRGTDGEGEGRGANGERRETALAVPWQYLAIPMAFQGNLRVV